MDKILFLDFDGPLFSNIGIGTNPHNKVDHPMIAYLKDVANNCGDTFGASCLSYWKMDDLAVQLLNDLHSKIDFKVVVSSSWNRLFGKDFIDALFNVNKLNLKFHDNWTTKKTRLSDTRNGEICDWLGTNIDTLDYIILDDTSSGYNLTYHVNNHRVIFVDQDNGFTQDDYNKMLKIWNPS